LLSALLFWIQRALLSLLEYLWLSKHKIPIDCAKTSFKLNTLDRNELEYINKSVVISKADANHVKLNQLHVSQGFKVRVVNKFSDVSFEELSVMPPDSDIEYEIE
jgi:hypothetical protein